MGYRPAPDPDDADLPGNWTGGSARQIPVGFCRIFINKSRELCIHYMFPGGGIFLERIYRKQNYNETDSQIRDGEILHWMAGSEFVALDKSLAMIQQVEEGMIEYE